MGRALNLPHIPDIPDAQKVKMVLSAIEGGYEEHVLLSADISDFNQLKTYWGSGYSTALLHFVPKLRYAGVTEDTIRKILIDNPRRFLAFVPKDSQ